MKKLFVITMLIAGLVGASALAFGSTEEAIDSLDEASPALVCELPLVDVPAEQSTSFDAAQSDDASDDEGLVCTEDFCAATCIARGCLGGTCEPFHGRCICFLC